MPTGPHKNANRLALVDVTQPRTTRVKIPGSAILLVRSIVSSHLGSEMMPSGNRQKVVFDVGKPRKLGLEAL